MKEWYTLKELYSLYGSKPMVVTPIWNAMILELIVLEETIIHSLSDNMTIRYEDIYQAATFKVVDYFEEETNSQLNVCQCDFYSVILVSGCMCGGI